MYVVCAHCLVVNESYILLLLKGVDSQTRCYVKNRCTSGDIAASPAECCYNKISDITRGCGHRNSDNCNVFFNKPGGLCRPCVCK